MNSKKLLLSFIGGFAFLLLAPTVNVALACPGGRTAVPISRCNDKYGTSYPEYVCCRRGNEHASCPGPWTAVDFQCCALPGPDPDEQLIEQYISSCYSTDVCDPPQQPHQNERIRAGLCGSDGGYGVQCTVGGWYKTCCINDQGAKGICGIDYPYDNSCDSGSVVRYDDPNIDFQTCLAKGPQQHRECQGSSCVVVSGSGTDQCQVSSDCTSPTHRECVGTSCQTVSGSGANLCNSDPDCQGGPGGCAIPCNPGEWYGPDLNCGKCGCGQYDSARCNQWGSGWDCIWNPGLCGGEPPEPEDHTECSGGSCVTVSGAGSDECSSSDECRHYVCDTPPTHSSLCRLVSSPGSDECFFDEECQPAECSYTAINGGNAYTNTRSVVLNLDAENANQMRFRNQSLTWSSWESYNTSKNWTLSSGADGNRSVTVQYNGPKGTSDPSNPVCTDSIILDTTPPASSITPLPAWSTTNPITLNWSGSDNLAPADELRYWLQYNIDGGSWIDLESSQSNPTSDTSYAFTGAEGTLYCFRVRAYDPAGNWEDWPVPYDTCTSIDVGVEMYGFGYEFGVQQPDVWVSVYDGVSGISYSDIQCWYSRDNGIIWTGRTCYCGVQTCAGYTLSADPITVSMSNVPFDLSPPIDNKVRFRACDNAGNCITNTYTVDNRITGPWVQTYGGDIHSNSNIQLREAP